MHSGIITADISDHLPIFLISKEAVHNKTRNKY